MAAFLPLQGLPTGDLFIVVDDRSMRAALSLVFTRAGLRVRWLDQIIERTALHRVDGAANVVVAGDDKTSAG